MSVYEKLNGGEKAALVQSWQRFSRALLAAEKPHNALKLVEPGGFAFDGNIERLQIAAHSQLELAKTRAAYLFLIQSTWFRARWMMRGAVPNPALPKRWFKGQDLDQILYEEHPVNLFQAIEEEAQGAEETVTP